MLLNLLLLFLALGAGEAKRYGTRGYFEADDSDGFLRHCDIESVPGKIDSC